MKYLLTLSIFVLTLVSCSSAKKTAQALTDASWELAGIQGFVMEKTMEPVTLSFNATENRISGNAGCNGFGGEYVLNAKTITFSKLLSTERACTVGMATENAYMNALKNVDGYTIKEGVLLLTQGGKTVLEFKKK